MLPKLLSKSYSTEKQLFLIPKFALKLIGFYPEAPRKFLALFNYLILVYGIYAEFYFGIHYISIDVVTALDAFCPVASSIMSMIKVSAIWWYRDEFKYLIERVRLLTEQQTSNEKTKLKQMYFTLATRLNALVLFFAFNTSNAYFVRPIILNILRYVKGEPIKYETPFKMMFPNLLLSMPLYPITYLMVHWHGYITLLCFVGGDGFFLAFCLYFTTLLKSLQLDIRDVLVEIPLNKKLSRAKEQEICDKLAALISRHNEVDELTKRFSKIVRLSTLGHFVTSSIIIGTSVIDLLLFPGYGGFVYVVYTCAVLTEIFLYCLGGTALSESSQEVATVAYSSHWYCYSVKIQKMVLLLMLRSQRNFIINVPFFAPSLPTLASILRFTGSLIALAQQIL